jgi:hypothetical protein
VRALTLLLTGCASGFPWGGIPAERGEAPLPIRPVVGDAVSVGDPDAAWTAMAARVAGDWAEALAPYGCPPPFIVSESAGHLVWLVPEAEWHQDDGYLGMTYPDDGWGDGWSEVRWMGDFGRHRILLHELGHALGLDHHPDAHTGGADGIMTPAPTADLPTAEEAASAAAIIGCRL